MARPSKKKPTQPAKISPTKPSLVANLVAATEAIPPPIRLGFGNPIPRKNGPGDTTVTSAKPSEVADTTTTKESYGGKVPPTVNFTDLESQNQELAVWLDDATTLAPEPDVDKPLPEESHPDPKATVLTDELAGKLVSSALVSQSPQATSPDLFPPPTFPSPAMENYWKESLGQFVYQTRMFFIEQESNPEAPWCTQMLPVKKEYPDGYMDGIASISLTDGTPKTGIDKWLVSHDYSRFVTEYFPSVDKDVLEIFVFWSKNYADTINPQPPIGLKAAIMQSFR